MWYVEVLILQFGSEFKPERLNFCSSKSFHDPALHFPVQPVDTGTGPRGQGARGVRQSEGSGVQEGGGACYFTTAVIN